MNRPCTIPHLLRPGREWSLKSGSRSPRHNLTGPVVSIVMPSYNQGAYIEAAIRSVLLQDYPQIELIIMDGGSTDGTAEILNHYAAACHHVVSEPDNGQAHAINKGLAHATGGLLAYLNSDDMLTPGCVSAVVRAWQQQPEAALIHGDRILIDEQGNVIGWSVAEPWDINQRSYPFCSESSFWTRPAMDRVGLFDEQLRFALDLEYFIRIAKDQPTVHCPRFNGYLRVHSQTKSNNMAEIGQQEARAAWLRHLGREMHTGCGMQHDRMRQRYAPLRHPLLIGWPYVRWRIFR
jgi:glycosyltransferase involved in cell wall biosynthesis